MSTTKSSQTHFVGQQGWNDLGEMSARSSRVPTPATHSSSDSPEASASSIIDDYVMVDIGKDQVISEVSKLFDAPTRLPDREMRHYKQRILAILPDLEEHYPVVLEAAVRALQSPQERQAAKEQLVEYSLNTNETASWILPMRRIVENVNL